MTTRFALLSIAAFLIAASCSDESPTEHTPSNSAFDHRAFLPTIDDEFADLADRAPGFGGLFYDESGNLTAYVAANGDSAAVLAHVTTFVRSRGGSVEANVRIRSADFNYRQLLNWYRALDVVWALDPVVATDIDERLNRITVSVDDPTAVRAVQTTLENLGIPLTALMVKYERDAESLAAENVTPEAAVNCATLLDVCRPFAAGVAIHIGTPDPSFPGNWLVNRCTLSYLNVTAAGDSVLVTNSHCTHTDFGVDAGGVGSMIRQGSNFFSDSNPTYREWKDPPLFAGGSCPGGRLCRFSDAILAKLESGTTNGNLIYWAVQKTQGFPSTCCTTNVDQSTQYPWVTVMPPATGTVYSGQIVHKVGTATGNTWGPVETTCQNREYDDTNYLLLCQMTINMAVDRGDSGSPVFPFNAQQQAGYFVGVLHARFRNWQNQEFGVASHIWGIRNDIPELP